MEEDLSSHGLSGVFSSGLMLSLSRRSFSTTFPLLAQNECHNAQPLPHSTPNPRVWNLQRKKQAGGSLSKWEVQQISSYL